MTSHDPDDPIFTQLKAAWLAFEALQPGPPNKHIPFTDAVDDAGNPALQTAARELAEARLAWLNHPANAASNT